MVFRRAAIAIALLLAVAQAADRAIDEPEDDEVSEAVPDLDYAERLASFQQAAGEALLAAKGGELIPEAADEWYTVTIADVSVGYMHTTTVLHAEDAKGGRGPGVTTTELMDVQVSRGTDTSRMAFETTFVETGLDPKNTTAMPGPEALRAASGSRPAAAPATSGAWATAGQGSSSVKASAGGTPRMIRRRTLPSCRASSGSAAPIAASSSASVTGAPASAARIRARRLRAAAS